jgi:hypothetical protein
VPGTSDGGHETRTFPWFREWQASARQRLCTLRLLTSGHLGNPFRAGVRLPQEWEKIVSGSNELDVFLL